VEAEAEEEVSTGVALGVEVSTGEVSAVASTAGALVVALWLPDTLEAG